MAKSIQFVQGVERIEFFGIRHLSPAGTFHLLQLLNQKKPKCLLIEGPSNADCLINSIAMDGTTPPIAILSYTADLPVRSILYPYAEYSPEYAALCWAKNNNAQAKFIDLPTDVTLRLDQLVDSKEAQIQAEFEESTNEADDEDTKDSDDSVKDDNSHVENDENDDNSHIENCENKSPSRIKLDFYAQVHALYEKIARIDGENSYNEFWERNFEHNLNIDSYKNAVSLLSKEIRLLTEHEELESAPLDTAVNSLREGYMAAQIEQALQEFEPEDIIVVTGAYHTLALKQTIPMTREQIESLPRRESKLTLIPYSFLRLSTRTGYGAGNAAPEYFNLMWKCIQEGKLDELPMRYVGTVGRYMRSQGGYCSTANVIEAVRLANALSAFRQGSIPVLQDLHDAIKSVVGGGEASVVSQAIAATDIGVAIGSLPEGISLTSTQDDMLRQLKSLRLEKYKTATAQRLDLDLRENTRVSSKESAFLDLNRSFFLHRLSFLDIDFAKKLGSKSSWAEAWALQWSLESEVRIAESVLLGETIELAAAFKIKEELEKCTTAVGAAKLIAQACLCNLANSVENAVSLLQSIAADSMSFIDNALAAWELSIIIQYGSLRKTDPKPLIPLLEELFFHASLLLVPNSTCDNAQAKQIMRAMNNMHTISQENYDLVDDKAWVNALKELASCDDKNAMLSGLAFAILLERNLIDTQFCSSEISRRLSLGVPASEGAAWFEGVSERNHYALISRIELWQELNRFLNSLDEDEFRRSVVYLRRAFSTYNSREKGQIAELLASFWNVSAQTAAIFLQDELSSDEAETLCELNDFDFDF